MCAVSGRGTHAPEPLEANGRTAQFLRDLNTLFAEAGRAGGDVAFLQRVLDACLSAVDGRRGFIVLVNHETGALEVCCTAGAGWDGPAREVRLHLAEETSRGITGHVALTALPHATGDVARDPYYLRYFDDVKSEAAVPILGPTGKTRGVVTVDSVEPRAFDADDVAHLVALAQVAAIALHLDGFRAREAALIEIGKALTATLDVTALMKRAVDVASKALRFEDCSIFLLDEREDELVLKASRGRLAAQVGAATYALGEGVTGWVGQHGEPVRIGDPRDDPRWIGRHTELPREEIGALMAVPVISRDRTIGVLRVLRRKSQKSWYTNEFTEVDERVLSTIASQIGAAVENARSHKRLLRAERMAAWGELSARSAHMIGNRTFALKGDLNELNYLLDSLPAGASRDDIRRLADSMGRGIERLEELLREFRDFVVATELQTTTSDINSILREAVEESFPRRGSVALRLNLADGLPTVQTDSRKLKRALSELIENAISFQPAGGEVSIATRLAMPDELAAAKLTQGQMFVHVEIADRGPGVPDALKQRIFRPFFTSRTKGMGLGLSIVKGIVEAHQGAIVESGRAGEGARFVIYLPAES